MFCFAYSEFELSLSGTYTAVTNEELSAALGPLTSSNPNIGYRGARAYLQSHLHIKLPFERVRLAMIEINSAAVALRWGLTVKRRM